MGIGTTGLVTPALRLRERIVAFPRAPEVTRQISWRKQILTRSSWQIDKTR